jgi:hypothetical protein
MGDREIHDDLHAQQRTSGCVAGLGWPAIASRSWCESAAAAVPNLRSAATTLSIWAALPQQSRASSIEGARLRLLARCYFGV